MDPHVFEMEEGESGGCFGYGCAFIRNWIGYGCAFIRNWIGYGCAFIRRGKEVMSVN
jgi:hypothetical protein